MNRTPPSPPFSLPKTITDGCCMQWMSWNLSGMYKVDFSASAMHACYTYVDFSVFVIHVCYMYIDFSVFVIYVCYMHLVSPSVIHVCCVHVDFSISVIHTQCGFLTICHTCRLCARGLLSIYLSYINVARMYACRLFSTCHTCTHVDFSAPVI